MRITVSKIHLNQSLGRVVARPLELKDFEAWVDSERSRLPKQHQFDRASDSEMELTKINFKKMLSTYKKARQLDKNYNFAVFEKKTSKIIGNFYICPAMRWNIQSCTVGYGIHNMRWGQGFGKEALSAAIEIAFRKLKFFRVDAHIHPGNKASIALASSLGMRKEGLLKGFNTHNNKRVDNLVYAITAHEWGLRNYRPIYGLSLKELV